MSDSLSSWLSAIDSKFHGPEPDRRALVRECVDALRTSSTADAAALPQALADSEVLLGELEGADGGKNSAKFASDLRVINRAVDPRNNPSKNYLPFLEVQGLDSKGHIQVRDLTDNRSEVLVDDHNLLEPTAPAVIPGKNKLFYQDSNGHGARAAIEPGDVQQGFLGDCYFLSSLQTVAANDPESVRRMIHDNGADASGSHTYTVIFPGAKDKPVTVAAPTSYDVAATAQNSNGLWTNVLEKAHRVLTGKNMHDDGGDPAEAMSLLTGKEAITVKNVANLGTMEDVLSALHGHEVVAGALKQSKVLDAAGNEVFVLAPHAYSFVAFDSKTKMVTLSNPQNYNFVSGSYKPEPNNIHNPDSFDRLLERSELRSKTQPMTGRLLTISLKDFVSKFDDITVTP